MPKLASSPSFRFHGHVGFHMVDHNGLTRMVKTVREALTNYNCKIQSMVVEKKKGRRGRLVIFDVKIVANKDTIDSDDEEEEEEKQRGGE